MHTLKQLTIPIWPLENNKIINNVSVTYHQYGLPIGTAPVILINHSVHGDSDCLFHWDGVIGNNNAIDLTEYTVICFDVPGNDVTKNLNYSYLSLQNITARDISVLFWLSLFELDIKELFAVIGADLGGGIAWEMATIFPRRILNIIPIASSPKTEDWLIEDPLAKNDFLKSLFYSVDISRNRQEILKIAQLIKGNIHVISVKNNSYYNKNELKRFYTMLSQVKQNVSFYQLEEINDNEFVKENRASVDKVVDGILLKEFINNVA